MLQAKTQNLDGQVVSLKLTIGGNSIIEVLGKLVHQDEHVVRVENPQALTPHHVPGQQQPEIAMINFMLSGDNKIVEFTRTSILAIGKTAKAAEDEYNRITSSIITPGKPNIIT
jgi:UPF0288 family protein (methanogenesis marker protein 3)